MHSANAQAASTASITALVLAGGQSSRMGQDKALIPIQGVPLLRRVYDVASQCSSAVWVITPWPERYRPLLPPCHWVQEVPLPGETKPHGPLVGFAQGLAQAETEWVLLLACDLPRLQAPVLQAWAQNLSPGNLAVVPHEKQGWQPLCGFYHRDSYPALCNFLAQGGRSFQVWLEEIQAKPLPPLSSIAGADPDMLLNCNLPEDLARAEQ
ncbi:molybdenum cofactor guanylyltransferase [Leptolyngbya sp. FACHB-261]|uniref:molybdenum cofactor guanylyltransferase n=1 Tax=Leptolyngbya sp. FACHB-261 TaxID=2692806 RepID=UPI001683BBB8|nr:molybdenum cofactor guanylyltransferase [Leptolyngbya sp. FACHB-261]MBD2101869.1 molybdenum cofactor guanylyltransferase [Leptolyngbya sp. FACHB-261]